MRPTVQEQLQGTARVLEEVIAPHIDDPYASNILSALISNLGLLVTAAPAAAQFVRWDNEAVTGLLRDARFAPPTDLLEEIDLALSESEPDPTDWEGLEERNRQLRALLVTMLREGPLPPALDEQLVAYMTERASRHPMRYVLPAMGAPRQEKN